MTKNENNMSLLKLAIVKVCKFISTEPIFGGFKPFGTIAFQNYSGGFLAKNAGIFIFDQVPIDYSC